MHDGTKDNVLFAMAKDCVSGLFFFSEHSTAVLTCLDCFLYHRSLPTVCCSNKAVVLQIPLYQVFFLMRHFHCGGLGGCRCRPPDFPDAIISMDFYFWDFVK